MKITKLIVKNFKSFDTLIFSEQENHQQLNDVNILVGANASGKSNFIHIFEFLKEIKKSGIEKTVKEKYRGIDKLKNFNTNKNSFSIEIELSSTDKTLISELDKRNTIYRVRTKIAYEITLMRKKKSGLLKTNNFDLLEKITFHEKYVIENSDTLEIKDLSSEHIYGIENNYGNFKLFANDAGITRYKWNEQSDFNLEISSPYPSSFIENLNSRYKNKSILEYDGVFIPSDIFDFGIYDFEPKKAKGAKVDISVENLDKNGENLSLIIKEILKDEEKAEQFIADVSAMLDFVEDIKIQKFEDIIDLHIKESCNKIETESSLLSEGTISIISIIVALYYQKQSIIFIEEPEYGIHPSLVADLMDMIYDVAESFDKQILITTHSPELLRVNGNNRIENILLIEKKNCFSQIMMLGKDKNKLVKAFLENDLLSADTLFIQNLLDA